MKQAERRKYHYIYKITRTDGSGKFYIGMHSTDNLEDGYFGSGKRLWYSINKHGKDKHSKEILEHFESREALKLREREIVNEELLEDKLCLNICLGGGNSWSENASELGRAANKRKFQDPEYRKKFCLSISSKNIESYKNGNRIPTGWPAEALKNANSESAKAKRIKTMVNGLHQQGEKNSQFGTKRIGIHKDGVIKKIPHADFNRYIADGWLKGFKEKPVKLKTLNPKISKIIWVSLCCEACLSNFNASKKDIRRGRKFCSVLCSNKRIVTKVTKNGSGGSIPSEPTITRP